MLDADADGCETVIVSQAPFIWFVESFQFLGLPKWGWLTRLLSKIGYSKYDESCSAVMLKLFQVQRSSQCVQLDGSYQCSYGSLDGSYAEATAPFDGSLSTAPLDGSLSMAPLLMRRLRYAVVLALWRSTFDLLYLVIDCVQR